MHIPLQPPNYDELIGEIIEQSPDRLVAIMSLAIAPDQNQQYYHWDKLRHFKNPPENLTHREWWFAIKSARKSLYQNLPHYAKDKSAFAYSESNLVRRLLHQVDIHGGGELKSSYQVANPATRNTYLINSLIEEAITSSQLEGAATTRKVAKEMLRQKRRPTDKSEKMIVNNYLALEFIKDIANEELSPSTILELHRILTEGTLDNAEAEGKIRENDEIYIGDERDATILHIPPKSMELKKRLESICRFANDHNAKNFIHPVIRAIVLHFLLAYDHPFEDGNGRTARALFYWSMLKQGYWTMEFISISRILKKAPAQYTRSYLYTETDDNDVTYFIVHQLNIIKKAIEELFTYLQRKTAEQNKLESLISKSKSLQSALNYRQMAALGRAIKHSDSIFTVESHRGAHDIAYETARTDLLKMVNLNLLEKSKRGNAFIFTPHKTLKQNGY